MSVANQLILGANSALAAATFSDLYLDMYGGEVLTRFNEYLGITASVMQRNIMTGNTARFPRLGGIGAERHARGTRLLGLDAERTELSIGIDERPLVSHFRIDDVDDMLMHFESRSEYAAQSAQALQEAQDRYTARLLVNASRATPTSLYGGASSSFPGGGIDGNGAAIDVDMQNTAGAQPSDDQIGNFLDAIDRVVIRWDNLRVPFEARKAWVDVPFWHGVRQFGSPRSATDLNNGRQPLFMTNDGTYGPGGGQEQFGPGAVPDFNTAIDFNGIFIRRSNLLPNGQNLSNDDEQRYRGDFRQTRAILSQERAVGVVTKMDIQTEAGRMIDYQDFLFVTKMLSGGGTVRAECAVEFIDSNT